MRGPFRWVLWLLAEMPTWLNITAAVISAAVAFALGIVADGVTGWRQGACIAAGGVFTVAAVGLPVFEQWRASRVAAQMLSLITEVVDPISNVLGELADAPAASRRNELRGTAKMAILNAVVDTMGSRSRACFYRIDGAGNSRCLTADRRAGRADEPKTDFSSGSAAGQAALRMLDKNEARFNPDVDKRLPTGWESEDQRVYKTFIAVPVATPARLLGMITVDSPDVGSLTEDDVNLLRVFARMLAASLRIGSPADKGRA